MTAVSTITSTDTATMPLSRPLSSRSAFDACTVVPRARREREAESSPPASSVTSTSPVSSVSSVSSGSSSSGPISERRSVENASGARLIIPAVSLRQALAEPTRVGRIQSLNGVTSFSPPELPEPMESTLVESTPAPPSLVEATAPVRRPFRLRVGKATALASVVGGILVLLAVAFSTTDTAAMVASRIHMFFGGEEIPAAAADPAPPAPMTPVAVAAVAEPQEPQAAEVAPVVDLELPATPAPAHNKPRAAARPVRIAHPSFPMPIRLRSPY